MEKFIKFICVIVLLAIVVGGIALIYKYTNGFNEDFKTFYIEYDGKQILTENTVTEFDPKKEHVFTVKYTFDKEYTERDFTVKVLPNAVKDFDFTVGNKAYKYSKAKELTTVFEIIKDKDRFEIKVNENQNVYEVLKSVYGDEVKVPVDAEINEFPYVLVISSYNGNVNYRIAFKIKGVKPIPENAGPTDPDEPDDPDEPNIPTEITDIEIPEKIIFTGRIT